jgi:hypothetical protein
MNLNDFYQKRSELYLNVSSRSLNIVYALMAIGLVGVGYGFATEPSRVWGALLTSGFFAFSIAFGGAVFGQMQDVVGAVWGRPIRRIHQAFSAFLIPASILLIVIMFAARFKILGAGDVYKWIADPAMVAHKFGKNFWLTPDFWLIRNTAWIIIINVVMAWFKKENFAADQDFLAGKLDQAAARAKLAGQRLRFWSGPLLFVVACGFTFLTFDLTMSLSPHWFSTLWGVWSFAVLMQSLLAAILVALFLMEKTSISQYYRKGVGGQFHDVGKMMHGFTAFFGYTTYAHILTYWYANMPEETEYFIHRLHAPWIYIVIAVAILCFVLPFFVLIPKPAKYTKAVTLPLCLIVLLGQWLNYNQIVMSEVIKKDYGIPVAEFGALFLILGGFLLAFFMRAKSSPMIPATDPKLIDALSSGH